VSRYYFDFREGGEVHLDSDGLELASAEIACAEATRSLADMARDAVRAEGTRRHQMSIEVRDDNGVVSQMSFTFNANRSPRTGGSMQYQRKIYQSENGDSWWLCRDDRTSRPA